MTTSFPNSRIIILWLLLTIESSVAFSPLHQPRSSRRGFLTTTTTFRSSSASTTTLSATFPNKEDEKKTTAGGVSSSFTHQQHNNHNNNVFFPTKMAASIMLSTILWTSTTPFGTTTTTACAYEDTDYASDTVQNVIRSLQESKGDATATFSAYEEIAAIITEGKGVGGEIDYKGVALNRGYVSDEDTSIYNPGLTLLTESEKERLVSAVIDARKTGLANTKGGGWNDNNQVAYDFLKEKLDPLHMTELRGYLSILPIYGAVWYLVALGVQQNAREGFPFAYLLGVAGVFGPAIVLILLGP
mmetsp:Transcript_23091/g.32233  ORF Transcript_23091/g.32233 Transcript_23091/m.32233 type:complete len:301 (+) Transcript_23091:183-1085(+)